MRDRNNPNNTKETKKFLSKSTIFYWLKTYIVKETMSQTIQLHFYLIFINKWIHNIWIKIEFYQSPYIPYSVGKERKLKIFLSHFLNKVIIQHTYKKSYL